VTARINLGLDLPLALPSATGSCPSAREGVSGVTICKTDAEIADALQVSTPPWIWAASIEFYGICMLLGGRPVSGQHDQKPFCARTRLFT